jgi:hypothetical protein
MHSNKGVDDRDKWNEYPFTPFYLSVDFVSFFTILSFD